MISETQLRAALEAIPMRVALLDRDRRYIYVNRHYIEFAGKTEAEILGRTEQEVLAEEGFAVLYPQGERALTGEVITWEGWLEYRQGRRYLQRYCVPLLGDDGAIAGYFVFNRDLTALKVSEQALAEQLTARTASEALKEALAARERDLRSIIDTIPTLAWSASPDGSADFLNQRWLDYTGMSAEQAQGWGWRAAIHPDDVKGLVKHWHACLASGTSLEAEARMRRFDGANRWFLFRANPSRDEAGKIAKWYGTNIDIEDRKRGEEALRASELSWRQIVDNIPGLVATMGATGEVEFLNRQTLEYFGTKREDLKNWALIGVVHPDDLPRAVEAWAESVEKSQIYEIEHRCRRADGVFRWFQVRGLPVRDANGTVTSWYLLLTDIDERKQAEDKLRRSEAFLAEGQGLSRTGSFSWRVETGEITWSKQLYRIFEFPAGDPVTLKRIITRIHPDDISSVNEMVERAETMGGDFEHDHRLLMPDGSIKYLHLVAHRTQDSQPRLEYIGAVRDVTERRVAEEALAKARAELAHVARVLSFGALTASIAHEVSQPVAGIILNTGACLRMLEAKPPNVEGAREAVLRTQRDGTRASEVITRLRALFSKKSTATESVDLNDATREVIALSMSDLRRARVILRTELTHDLPPVTGDRIQLQQVILNLLMNAADAMNGVEDRPRQLLVRTDQDEAGCACLTVRDAGVGIEGPRLDKLFEAFYTTKSNGMGIGLSVSRSIIESHGGRLWAAPNDGPGATFSFSIPLGPGGAPMTGSSDAMGQSS